MVLADLAEPSLAQHTLTHSHTYIHTPILRDFTVISRKTRVSTLFTTLRRDNTDVVKALLGAGAKESKNKRGKTPSDLARSKDVEKLLHKGARPPRNASTVCVHTTVRSTQGIRDRYANTDRHTTQTHKQTRLTELGRHDRREGRRLSAPRAEAVCRQSVCRRALIACVALVVNPTFCDATATRVWRRGTQVAGEAAAS